MFKKIWLNYLRDTLDFSKLLMDVTRTIKCALINIRSFSMVSKLKTVLHLSTSWEIFDYLILQ